MNITRSGRLSKPYDCTRDFTETGKFYKDHIREEGVCLKPHYADEDNWTMKLGKGMFHSNCYFGEDVIITETESEVGYDKIMHWNDSDQCSLHREALGCLGHQGSVID